MAHYGRCLRLDTSWIIVYFIDEPPAEMPVALSWYTDDVFPNPTLGKEYAYHK